MRSASRHAFPATWRGVRGRLVLKSLSLLALLTADNRGRFLRLQGKGRLLASSKVASFGGASRSQAAGHSGFIFSPRGFVSGLFPSACRGVL